MAEELQGVGCIESQNKNQIADNFLENDGLNLQKLGELFEECEKEYESTEMNDRYNYLQYFFPLTCHDHCPTLTISINYTIQRHQNEWNSIKITSWNAMM